MHVQVLGERRSLSLWRKSTNLLCSNPVLILITSTSAMLTVTNMSKFRHQTVWISSHHNDTSTFLGITISIIHFIQFLMIYGYTFELRNLWSCSNQEFSTWRTKRRGHDSCSSQVCPKTTATCKMWLPKSRTKTSSRSFGNYDES